MLAIASRHHHRRHAGVDQRRDRHVAGDAGGRLEVQVLAAQLARASLAMRRALHRSRFRLIIAASWPAPKPLSMLTTATPAAHEFSIDSSAAMPPRLAP